ncbi:MAG: methylated-DNA--[protein]-cysteine S-methyltransferase [Clostridia bacterium]|nr:methylated-DNA--[protein]-cysteine S-methyltransferase [Clostridia bacterium]
MKIYLSNFTSPVGRLILASTTKGLCKLTTPGEKEAEVEEWLNHTFPGAVHCRDSQSHEEVAGQMAAYFTGAGKTFNYPLDLRGTSFQLRAWQALLDIPYGETRTYQEQAIAVGNPKGVRAIGGANNRNPVAIIVPCHRVIGKDGRLVGYGGGLEMKRFLLKLEGVTWRE